MTAKNAALFAGALLLLVPVHAAGARSADAVSPDAPRLAQAADPHGDRMPEGDAGAMPHGHPGGMPTPHPPTAEEQAEAAHGSIDISGAAKKGTTVVPDEVKGNWKAATFIVVDRESSKAQEVTVDLAEEWTFPDERLKVTVLEFLPDLRIDNKIYTSASNEPNNPAAHVVIHDGDEEVFDGWLFSEFPQVHRFEHPRFSITLKEGVPS